MHKVRLFLAPAISLVVLAHASAQTVHHVGVFGFLTIQAAISAASPGDIVRVDPGTHGPFTLDKGLTIIGSAAGGTTILSFGSTFAPTVTVPAGQVAHLVDLAFMTMTIGGGQVTLDRCAFTGSQPRLVIANAVVHMQHCGFQGAGNVTAPFPPLMLDTAEVFASDCVVRGLDGTPFALPGTAIAINASTFHGTGMTIAAGTGASPVAVPAVVADAASTVQLCDSTITATSATCPVMASRGGLARCTLLPNCSPLPPLPMLGVSRTSSLPPQIGQTLSLAFHSDPGALVFPWASLGLTVTRVPVLTSALLLDLNTAFPAGLLVADASGLAVGAWSIPATTALQYRTIWLQGFCGTSLPLASSVAVGGTIR